MGVTVWHPTFLLGPLLCPGISLNSSPSQNSRYNAGNATAHSWLLLIPRTFWPILPLILSFKTSFLGTTHANIFYRWPTKNAQHDLKLLISLFWRRHPQSCRVCLLPDEKKALSLKTAISEQHCHSLRLLEGIQEKRGGKRRAKVLNSVSL